MSTLPENELDLEKLFLPAWAQEPSSAKLYAHYEGGGERPDSRGERRGRRPGQRGGPGDRPGGQRPGGDRRGPRREGDRRGPGAERPGFRREEPRLRREPLPLPELNTSFFPDEKGVESLARQIKSTGRAYPLFDIARLILQRPERYSVTYSVRKNPEGKVLQPLFVCALDETIWLSEDEAVAHVLGKHFGTFYQAERTPTEPPKGKYTFVAQCGMSGVILGPPNYHDYQNQLRKLHAERFSRMPFEAFKARVKIVRDEEIVKKWIDDQSWKTDYICLNLPEPVRLGSREAVEKHFREVHKDNIIKPVESHMLSGVAARSLHSGELARLMRYAWEEQKRFPLQLATLLSQRFASQGLQFFKVNKAVTHVSVARPHFLDLVTTPVSDGVKRIVLFIETHPRCTRRKLVEELAPTPLPPPVVIDPIATPVVSPADSSPAPAATPAPSAEPTPEQTAIISDLHWLIHQGHVIEFANGLMETAKKPLPRPPKPAPKAKESPAAPLAGGSVPTEAAPAGTAPMEEPGLACEAMPASTQLVEEPASPEEPEVEGSEDTAAPVPSESTASTGPLSPPA